MTMDYKVIIGKPLTSTEHQRIERVLSNTFQEVDATFNKWNPESEVSKLNQLPANTRQILSPALARLFVQTDALVKLTGGRFDPTIEPIQALWKEHLFQGETPPQSAIDALSSAIGWQHVHVENETFYKDHDLTQLDFGGIAKGLAIDMLTERLRDAGYRNIFVEWGGEIRASGKHPEGRPWTVFISRFGNTNPDAAIDYVALNDAAIATSGDYLQYWTVPSEGQEVTFFHIIDPQTLRPLIAHTSAVSSASVVAPTCALADTLATTAMMFPTLNDAHEWASAIQDELPSIRIWLVQAPSEDSK